MQGLTCCSGAHKSRLAALCPRALPCGCTTIDAPQTCLPKPDLDTNLGLAWHICIVPSCWGGEQAWRTMMELFLVAMHLMAMRPFAGSSSHWKIPGARLVGAQRMARGLSGLRLGMRLSVQH